jgi:hypothetical protein
MINVPLSSAAEQARTEVMVARRNHEMAQLERLVSANPEQLGLNQRFRIGATLLAFELRLSPRTLVRDRAAPVIRRIEIRATFDLGPYPYGPPQIGMVSSQPLYLPGVGTFNVQGAQFFGTACLYRRFDPDRMDLVYLVRALWGVLTAAPSQLNAPADALLVEAAIWLLNHREEVGLPLDPPLREPEGSPVTRPKPTRRVRLEEP